jgi:hypothetical protein
MSESQSRQQRGRPPAGYQLNFVGLKPGEERPSVVIRLVDRQGKVIHTARVDERGSFEIPDAALRSAHRVLIGSVDDQGEEVDPESILRYRAADFASLLESRVISVPAVVWEKWFPFIRCVTGKVQLCRRAPWWYWDLIKLATEPLALAVEPPSPEMSIRSLAPQIQADVSLKAAAVTRISPAKSVTELINWPFHCRTICQGTVEVYRRTCCCEPWVIADPRLPELIKDLEDIIRRIPRIPPIPPQPNPPDPPPFAEALFFREGSIDELAVYAARDLAALRSLPQAETIAYVNARPYLFCRRYSCSKPVKVGQGFINPDGRFSICWFDVRRPNRGICHDEYAFIVRQTIHGFPLTIYNGIAANIWFDEGDDITLTSYSAYARACRDNGGTGDPFVYLDIIGDAESWNLKTPDATGWDSVDNPDYNDGLLFPAPTPGDAVGDDLNRNWGGVLKLSFKFSESMRTAPVGAKYYRVSITEANNLGNPVGTRHYISDGLSWEKAVPTGGGGVDIVPVTLGPFSEGTQNNLYLIPYDEDDSGAIEWNDGFYHAYLNTNDSDWNDPTKRHLVTLEVFDGTGQRLRPTGAPPTGLGEPEIEVPFTFRRRFQDLGPTQEVPFAALTHMFWWDNRPVFVHIDDLRMNGLVFNDECLFLEGLPGSTFGIGYTAYHENEMFQLNHTIWWKRGLSGGSGFLLDTSAIESTQNIGLPPPPGASPTATFATMLDIADDPLRTKCAFTVFLDIAGKMTDGDDLGFPTAHDTAAFALEIG